MAANTGWGGRYGPVSSCSRGNIGRDVRARRRSTPGASNGRNAFVTSGRADDAAIDAFTQLADNPIPWNLRNGSVSQERCHNAFDLAQEPLAAQG